MQEPAQFILWNDDRHSLADEIAICFPDSRARAFIKKKLTYYSTISVEQLMSSKKLDKIRGNANPALYELKIKGRVASGRFIAVRDSENLVRLLVVFKGSGSGGMVEHWLPKARSRI